MEETVSAFDDLENVHKKQFVIDSDSAADWYLGKLATLNAAKQRIRAQAKKMIEQVDTDIASLEYKFQTQLEQYCRVKIAESRRKSISFFNGTVAFRIVPSSLKIEDEDAFISHASASDELSNCIVVRHSIDKRLANATVKQVFEQTGELAPGVVFVPQKESMSINFGNNNDDQNQAM